MSESNMHPQQTQMTVEEYALLVALLCKVDKAKRLGTALFDALLAKTVGIAFEGVLFRWSDGLLWVFLVQRKLTETFYPGEWHAPGVFFLDGEQPADAAKRLAEREFKVAGFAKYSHVYDYFHTTHRGYIESKIYFVQLPNGVEPAVGEGRGWFPVDKLPPNTVDVHRDTIIPTAARWFWEKNRE